MIDAHGHVPLKDEPYKLLVNNCFTPYEIGSMTMACGAMLRNLINASKGITPNGKDRLKEQRETMSTSIGKLLLSLPEEHKVQLMKVLKDKFDIEFQIHEVQQPDKENIN